MKLENLKELFIHELKDIYSAETQMAEAMPKMVEAVSHPEFRNAMENHLLQTQKQISRLTDIFSQLGEKPEGETCMAMKGLIRESENLMKKDADPDVLDAGLIICAQKIEHYEIAAYGSAVTYAKMMGENSIAQLLQTTLDEEGATDKKLTSLAESIVNVDAMH